MAWHGGQMGATEGALQDSTAQVYGKKPCSDKFMVKDSVEIKQFACHNRSRGAGVFSITSG
jgi:hypothetical protein